MILLYCAAASLAGIALVVIFAHDRRALEGPATRDAQGPSGQKMVETEVRKDNAGLWKVLRYSRRNSDSLDAVHELSLPIHEGACSPFTFWCNPYRANSSCQRGLRTCFKRE